MVCRIHVDLFLHESGKMSTEHSGLMIRGRRLIEPYRGIFSKRYTYCYNLGKKQLVRWHALAR